MNVKVTARKPLKYVAFRASSEEVEQVKQFVEEKRANGERIVESDVYRTALAFFLQSIFTERKEDK